jgi:hypothetical protein
MLTDDDRRGNEEADRLAKLAVEEHRVPKHVRDMVKNLNSVVENTARWVARATYAAGHQAVKPFRDTDASKAAAVANARARALARASEKSRMVQVETMLPETLDGRVVGRSAREKARRMPRWPKRGPAVRGRRPRRNEDRHVDGGVELLLPRCLQPLVHPLTAAERRAGLYQRVRAKEAANITTAPPDAARATDAVEIAAVPCRSVGKRPHGLQQDVSAGEVGAASKRRKAAR